MNDELSSPPAAIERIANGLLALAVISTMVALVATWGWYKTATAGVDLGSLTDLQRQELVQALVDASPGSHRWSFYEPRISYTLVPNAELEIWDDRFTTNDLGFRAPPMAKSDGTYRVLFVGDSWTFGMGVSHEESFPLAFQRLAEKAGVAAVLGKSDVQAWTLALPGWSGISQVAAFDYFASALRPDAVVWVPSSNDCDTTPAVLPNGSLWGTEPMADVLGSPHGAHYRAGPLLSHDYLRRWRETFERIADAERRLSRRDIPLFLVFVAQWDAPMVHHLVRESGLQVPYAAVPPVYTGGTWVNPPPVGHATAATNELFGAAVYRLVASHLGWPPGSFDEEVEHRLGGFGAFDAPPDTDPADFQLLADHRTQRLLAEEYSIPFEHETAKVGWMDSATGEVGRATTLLVRRKADATAVHVRLSCLERSPLLYPLGLTMRISAAGGGTEARVEILDDPCVQEFSIAIPASIPAGHALDLVFEADRAADHGTVRSGRSFRLISIRQD